MDAEIFDTLCIIGGQILNMSLSTGFTRSAASSILPSNNYYKHNSGSEILNLLKKILRAFVAF